MKKFILQALARAKVDDYEGIYLELGGGELNDTFLINCTKRKLILRVARYADQKSLEVEAKTLSSLDIEGIPRLIFFDKEKALDGKLWIIETYVEGSHIDRLDTVRFRQLGKLLAKVHEDTRSQRAIDIWDVFLQRRKKYVSDSIMVSHPDMRLRRLYPIVRKNVQEFQKKFPLSHASIIHADATPANILVNEKSIGLIDWEFSHVNDPMAEFSTIYYEDMDYNNGKWRIKIMPDEKEALFSGYRDAGGAIDEKRIRLFENVDKLGAALYLYWRVHLSGRPTKSDQLQLYTGELEKLIASLEKAYGL